jgi:hypothetical protein
MLFSSTASFGYFSNHSAWSLFHYRTCLVLAVESLSGVALSGVALSGVDLSGVTDGGGSGVSAGVALVGNGLGISVHGGGNVLDDRGGLVDGHMLLLVHLLVDGGVLGDGPDDGLLGVDGLLAEDGAGSVVGVDDGGGLHASDGLGLVHVGGLGNGEGGAADLRGDLGVGVSLGGGVGKVASQAVGLDGCRVVCGCAAKGGEALTNVSNLHALGGGDSAGHEGKEGYKSLKEKLNMLIKLQCYIQNRFDRFAHRHYSPKVCMLTNSFSKTSI